MAASYRLGHRFVTADKGASVTALAYRTGAPGYGASAGHRYDAVEAKTCILKDKSTLSWSPWVLADKAAGQYPADDSTYDGFLTPQYPFSGTSVFSAGRCAEGWIYFEVPKATKLAAVDYGDEDGDSFEWKLN